MQGRADLEDLLAEYARLEANAEESAASDAVGLHDLQLQRLRLQTLLQRYQEKLPSAEELAERYEAEMGELAAEARQLREENALLAIHGRCEDDDDDLLATTCRPSLPSPRRSPRSCVASCGRQDANDVLLDSDAQRGFQRRRELRRAQLFAAQVHEEAREVWRCQVEVAARRRWTRVQEWLLGQLRHELQGIVGRVPEADRRLAAVRRRRMEWDCRRRQLSAERARCRDDVAREQDFLISLHHDAISLREACFVPAQIRKQSGALMKFLDQEGGRLLSTTVIYC